LLFWRFDVKNGSYGSYGTNGSYEKLFIGPIIPITPIAPILSQRYRPSHAKMDPQERGEVVFFSKEAAK
jgi:hypothetical protein